MPISSVHLKKKNTKTFKHLPNSSLDSNHKESLSTLQQENPLTLSIHNKSIFTIKPLHEINVEFLKKSFDKEENGHHSKQKKLFQRMVDNNSHNKESIQKLASFKEVVSLPLLCSLDSPIKEKRILEGPLFSFTSIPFSPISLSNMITTTTTSTTTTSPIMASSIASSPFPCPSVSSSSVSNLMIDSSTSPATTTTTSAYASNSRSNSIQELATPEKINQVPNTNESSTLMISPLSITQSPPPFLPSSSVFTQPIISSNPPLQPNSPSTLSPPSQTEPPSKLFLSLDALLNEPSIQVKSVSNHIQPHTWKPFFKLESEKRNE